MQQGSDLRDYSAQLAEKLEKAESEVERLNQEVEGATNAAAYWKGHFETAEAEVELLGNRNSALASEIERLSDVVKSVTDVLAETSDREDALHATLERVREQAKADVKRPAWITLPLAAAGRRYLEILDGEGGGNG